MSAPTHLRIRPLTSPAEAETCARMMAGSEPWITLGRGYEESLQLIADSTREVYAAEKGGQVAGFVILVMTGAVVGYVQTVCVAAALRNGGIGRALMAFAEERIFRESPNVFLSVSSFNPQARRLYERLGYETVGELRDHFIRGASEILMRKTRGPIREFEVT